MTRPLPCACGCGTTGRIKGRGLTKNCYDRERYHGRLADWPLVLPPAPTREEHGRQLAARHQEAAALRVDDYVFLRESGVSRDEARDRMGVTDRTITRWHRRLRLEGRRDPWLYDMPTNIYNRLSPDQQKESNAA